jgi:hypothetical protein
VDHPFCANLQLLNRLLLPRQQRFVPLPWHIYWINPGDAGPGDHDYLDPIARHRVSWPRSMANPGKARAKKGLRR